jgi:hypothetical protein
MFQLRHHLCVQIVNPKRKKRGDNMLNKDQLIEKMSERGFTVMSYSMKPCNVIETIYFVSEPLLRDKGISIPSIGCNVYMETGDFEFMYAVPASINVLRTPKCSPVDSDKHFDKICGKFELQASVLYKHFGGN